MLDAEEIIKIFCKRIHSHVKDFKEKHAKLKMLCPTKWVERHIAIHTIVSSSTLLQLSKNIPKNTAIDNVKFYFSFIVVLC